MQGGKVNKKGRQKSESKKVSKKEKKNTTKIQQTNYSVSYLVKTAQLQN